MEILRCEILKKDEAEENLKLLLFIKEDLSSDLSL